MINLKSKNVAFIYAYGRTGSSALHSMLDNHNEILMLPMELKFYSCIYKSNSLKKIDEIFNFWTNKTKLTRFKKNILYGGNSTEKFTNINFAKFKENFYELLNIYGLTRSGIFYAIHHAYAQSLNKNIDEIKIIIEFSADTLNLNQAKEDFNNFKILNVMRDFKAAFSSTKMNILKNNLMLSNRNKFYLPNFFTYYQNLSLPLLKLQDIYNVEENTINILLEDLHNDPEQQMKLVSNFLKIQYDSTLLKNTLGGYNWKGNSAFQKEVTTGRYNPLKNINNSLNYNEIILIEYLFEKYYDKYYKKKFNIKLTFKYFLNILKPFKFEFIIPKFKSFNNISFETGQEIYEYGASENYKVFLKNIIKININYLTSILAYIPLRLLLLYLIYKKKMYN